MSADSSASYPYAFPHLLRAMAYIPSIKSNRKIVLHSATSIRNIRLKQHAFNVLRRLDKNARHNFNFNEAGNPNLERPLMPNNLNKLKLTKVKGNVKKL